MFKFNTDKKTQTRQKSGLRFLVEMTGYGALSFFCDHPEWLRKKLRAADYTVQKGYRAFLAVSTNLRFNPFDLI